MKLNNVFVFFTIVLLLGCGGSSGGSNDEPVIPVIPPVIEDISCDVNYALAISNILIENTTTALPTLFDTDKTNSSSWVSSDLTSNLIIELSEPALLKELIVTWKNMEFSHIYNISVSKDKSHWEPVVISEQSTKQAIIPNIIKLASSPELTQTGLFIKIELLGNELAQPSEIVEIEAFGCSQDVNHNIELIDWYLSVPTDENNSGTSDSIYETDLAAGYFDARFFHLSEDGGLTFSTSVTGYRTSTNTKYVRSELREMLRRGNKSYKTQGVNKNNWVFSSAPQEDLNNAGGIDGQLDVEVAVNHVTSTGENYQIGRVIIGQIHANDDEPVRLYYRKLPGNVNGSIYIAHEIEGGDDIYYELIGSRANDASNPTNGIPLNEKFKYSIIVEGNTLTVNITKSDGQLISQVVDMTNSGYDAGGQYQYFKAGVYNQNNSGDQHDYVKATFYKIDNTHQGN